jgi:hypothetical protein
VCWGQLECEILTNNDSLNEHSQMKVAKMERDTNELTDSWSSVMARRQAAMLTDAIT